LLLLRLGVAISYASDKLIADQPWYELPPRIANVLRPALPEVADEIIEAVRRVPAYARPLEGEFGAGIRAGVQEALRHFLAEIEAGGPVARADVYRALGQGEMRAGRSLDALLSAYRAGARVAWRRFVALGSAAGLEPETLYLLAESIFAYIDVLSAESAEGHASEQSAAASEAELHRRRLVRMLVREPPAEPASIQAAAAEARWELPRALAVLVASGPPGPSSLHLPPDAIVETIGEMSVAIVPDADAPGRLAELERVVVEGGVIGALGTTVDWPQAALSFARARAALELAGGRPSLIIARDHIGELMLRTDSVLAAELAEQQLAPLTRLSPGSRARMLETLRCWLAEQGRIGPMSERLGVHPQTARYRLGRLRDLFGASLDDPDERFWLDLALRVRSGR
jgi:hypothetical protein